MSDFKTRLYNFELTPPENTWDKIVAALDETTLTQNFSRKLYDFELAPPPKTWDKISSALGGQNMPVPFIKRLRPYYKYAAAAAIMGAIIFTISLLTSKQNVANTALEPTALPDANDNSSVSTDIPGVDPVINNNPSATIIYAGSGKKNKAIRSFNSKKLVSSTNHFNAVAALQSNFSEEEWKNKASALNYSRQAISIDQSQLQKVNRYMMFLRPDGYVIRISRKFAGMIGCMYNSAYVDNPDCSSQFNQWKEKLAKAPVSPSPDNFMDILTMIKLLQEN